MSIPTSGQKLKSLRRRRDFLSDRILHHWGNPSHDREEHAALSWAIEFLEEYYQPGICFPAHRQGLRERPPQTVIDRQPTKESDAKY